MIIPRLHAFTPILLPGAGPWDRSTGALKRTMYRKSRCINRTFFPPQKYQKSGVRFIQRYRHLGYPFSPQIQQQRCIFRVNIPLYLTQDSSINLETSHLTLNLIHEFSLIAFSVAFTMSMSRSCWYSYRPDADAFDIDRARASSRSEAKN